MPLVQSSKKVLLCYCFPLNMLFFAVWLGNKQYFYTDTESTIPQQKFAASLKARMHNAQTKILTDLNRGLSALFFLHVLFQHNDISSTLLEELDSDCLLPAKDGQLSFKNYMTALSSDRLYAARLEDVRRSHDLRNRKNTPQ